MTNEEMKNKYSAFITEISEILGLGKPVDILKLCATTDLFFRPLEKQIKELEEKVNGVEFVNKQLNEQLIQKDERCSELETRCNELFLQNCEQAEKIKELKAEIENDRDLPAIAYMQGAEKQKKKDEEELKKWKDEWQEQVQKANDESYARTLQTIQLTKAKEIIKAFLDSSDLNIKHKAEEFLGEF